MPIDAQEKAVEEFKPLSPFSSLTIDPEEISLILKTSDWKKIRQNYSEYEVAEPYRVITFDIVLDLSLVG